MEASTLGGDVEEDEEEEVEADPGSPEKARAVFERGYKDLKSRGEKENVSRFEDLQNYRNGIANVNSHLFSSASGAVGSLESFRTGAWR